MKKWISLTIVLLLVILLVACGSSGNSGSRLSDTEHNISPVHYLAENNVSVEEARTDSSGAATEASVVEASTQTEGQAVSIVTIQVGSASFTVNLYDNASTQVLLSQMPLTLNMSELNGNEKYYYLSGSLPTDSQRVGSINAGDLMLYGSDCLVLFYESFSTSYSYTRLGYIEGASGLKGALGSGGVEVTFSIDG